MVGASFPNFVDLPVEIRCRFGVDNEPNFSVARFYDFANIICSNVASIYASNGNDFKIFPGVAVISSKEFCLGFLKFWFESGCLLLLCHKMSISSLEKMCYNMPYHVSVVSRDDPLIFERWTSTYNKWVLSTYVPVAQLDRALACGAKGRTFESYRAYHNLSQKIAYRQFFSFARPIGALHSEKLPICGFLFSNYPLLFGRFFLAIILAGGFSSSFGQ